MSTPCSRRCLPVRSSTRFPTRISFGSLLVYPSPALTDEAKRAKTTIIRIKEDRVSHLPSLTLIEYAVREVRRGLAENALDRILGSEVTFVPIPRSAPLVRDAVWASRSICRALLMTHFGRD